MCKELSRAYGAAAGLVLGFLWGGASLLGSELNLGAEQFVQSGGVDILVTGYSVPSFVRWNGDDLPDLVVGEGSGTVTPKVRVYLNTGTAGAPAFSGYFFAQSNGADLTVTGEGCLGLFPRVVYWDGDGRKDLLIGMGNGMVRIYLNTATDEAPSFDGGTYLQVGQPGSKVNIDVGSRATPTTVDWNNDGRKDLVVGALDGKFHIFINEGTDTAPDFRVETFAQAGAGDLLVPSARSSPVIMDLDCDGNKDLLTGNTDGQLLFYRNTGTDAAPSFGAPAEMIEAAGVPIDLAGTPRSRPFVCDWTGDGLPDVLIGALDAKVHLYQGVAFIAGDVDGDGDSTLDTEDLAAFIAVLLGEPSTQCRIDRADMNDDGAADGLDIQLFVDAWLGG